jgi:hypothetical protein
MDYSFMKCRIALENIGEKEADNSFLLENTVDKQLEALKKTYEAYYDKITIIGWCLEKNAKETVCELDYYPLVFEDEYGDRHWIHAPYENYNSEISGITNIKPYILKNPIQGII